MTTINNNNVSFLSQTTSQTNNLNSLNTQMSTLEEQISSGQNYQTFAGYGGVTANTLQQTRVNVNSLQSYLDNITTVNNRIDQMNQALTSAQSSVQTVVDGIASALQQSPVDATSVINLAKNTLSFVQNLANLNVDGRYLFAGSDTSAQPVNGADQLTANMQTEVAGWLNGSISTDQFSTDVAGMSGTQLGMNGALSTSGAVTAQIDDNTNIDYTVNASGGFQQVIQALGAIANLQVPTSTDAPTASDVDTILQSLSKIAQNGVDQIQQEQGQLGNTAALITSIQSDHTQDQATLNSYLGTTENTNTTQATVQLQSLQTQLEASYEVTGTLSKLSLVNYLT